MVQARDVHPRLYRKFLVHAKKVAIREWRENRRRFGNLIRRETKRESGIVGFTDAAKRRGGKKMPKASTKVLGGEKRRN